MRKAVSVFLALFLLLTLPVVMSLPAAAQSVNRIDRVMWLTSDFKGVAATLTIREEDGFPSDFRDGDYFRLMLKPGIKWLRDSSGYVDADGNPVIPTISNSGGSEALIIDIVSDTTMSVTLPNEVNGVPITGNNDLDFLRIPLSVDLNGMTGDMYVLIDPVASGVSSGTGDTFGNVFDGTNAAANQPQLVETGVRGWDAITDAMQKATEKSKFTVKLNGNNTAPAALFNNISNKDILIRFETSSQIALEINGKEIATRTTNETEISLTLDTRQIPRDMLKDFTGIVSTRQFSINKGNSDDYPFVLHVFLERNRAGQQATLFRKDGGALEKITAAPVDSRGWSTFEIKLVVGDYIVLIGESEFALEPEPVTPPVEEKPDPPPAPWVNPYNDVTVSDWFYNAVVYVDTNGIFTGTSSNQFSPNLNLSRGMLVTALWRLAGKPTEGSNTFSDVATGEWFTEAVAWAATHGIVEGYEDVSFKPNASVTREQMAAIFYRYAGHTGKNVSISGSVPTYSDWQDVSAWAEQPFMWANENRIIQGKTNNLLDPQGLATRAEAATIFLNFDGVDR